ncbi:MAG: type III PLP-dependent enzyme [Pseudomonadota bacterium]|nr:type III PLP-dependent enzyme [Pseudomonadota bacterium]
MQDNDFSRIIAYVNSEKPDDPVHFFHPRHLDHAVKTFQTGFGGMLTYAVKANPDPLVIARMVELGMQGFDVASPAEMALVRSVSDTVALHYNNPVRSLSEIAAAERHGVRSWSIDREDELAKLAHLPKGHEIAVRLRLPVKGAAYDFGAKYGADPETAVRLLQKVRDMGLIPSMTFHPGTQCDASGVWEQYIRACADIAARAGVTLRRLNVGGGFAANRLGISPDLYRIFREIDQAVDEGFGANRPELICEPGRALATEAFSLLVRVKAMDDRCMTLNDGIYGGLAEWRDLSVGNRITCFAPDGTPRRADGMERIVFGPTCDSLDCLPTPLAVPGDLSPEDYILISGMGAYSQATATGFNGYGHSHVVCLQDHDTFDRGAGHRHAAA